MAGGGGGRIDNCEVREKYYFLEKYIPLALVQFLARVKPELRKVQAMMDLPKSQLFTSIVNPTAKTLVVRLFIYFILRSKHRSC